jgi:hypothetical protein
MGCVGAIQRLEGLRYRGSHGSSIFRIEPEVRVAPGMHVPRGAINRLGRQVNQFDAT